MEIRYNYAAMKQWLHANGYVSKQSLLDCLNKRDYTKMNKVVDGAMPLDIEDMVRLCNRYQIHPMYFFLNEDAEDNQAFVLRQPVPKCDMPLPRDGFPDPTGPKSGPKRVSPIVDKADQITTNLPNLWKATVKVEQKDPSVLVISPKNKEDIFETLQKKIQEVVSQAMSDIIPQLTETILSLAPSFEQPSQKDSASTSQADNSVLTVVLSQLAQTMQNMENTMKHINNDRYSIGMAAEDIHRE